MPDKEEKKKEVDQFRVGEVKDVGPGKTFCFKIQAQQYRSCLNLDANCCCYFPLFMYNRGKFRRLKNNHEKIAFRRNKKIPSGNVVA